MADRLKILDCNRKAILSLPDAAFKLWFCYYMNEDEDQESYMSLAEIEDQMEMRMSRRSIIAWTRWLLGRGWLVDVCGKTAADKFIQRGLPPTRGAYQIRVYRVDDPTAKNLTNCKECTSANSAPVHIAHKVSGFGSAFASALGSGDASIPSSDSVPLPPFPEKEEAEPEPRTPEPTAKPTRYPVQNRKGKVAGKTSLDGTPWPEDFNLWTNARRLAWLDAHSDRDEKLERDIQRDLEREAAEMDKLMEEEDEAVFIDGGSGYAQVARRPELPSKQTESPTPDVPCIFCGLQPRRSATSDYCAGCWSRKQRGEKLVPRR